MNVLLLWSEQMSRGFSASMWMTFKQALELGGAVLKDSTVVFASRFTKSVADGEGNDVDWQIPVVKAYSLFNVEQIDGLPDTYYARPAKVRDRVERIESADRFFRNTGAVIRHGDDQAYYSPVMDYIQMPPFEAFRDSAGYAAVLSHEATHRTAAEHRVGRDLSRYAKDRPDYASYLQSWLSVLSNDKRAIFQAAAHAQRATSFLHSLQPEADMKAAA